MDAKSKAEELVDKYCSSIGIWNLDSNFSLFDIAKRCALIAVDEILDVVKWAIISSIDEYEYWQEVRKEIEAL